MGCGRLRRGTGESEVQAHLFHSQHVTISLRLVSLVRLYTTIAKTLLFSGILGLYEYNPSSTIAVKARSPTKKHLLGSLRLRRDVVQRYS